MLAGGCVGDLYSLVEDGRTMCDVGWRVCERSLLAVGRWENDV
jgi:hypothetical protein